MPRKPSDTCGDEQVSESTISREGRPAGEISVHTPHARSGFNGRLATAMRGYESTNCKPYRPAMARQPRRSSDSHIETYILRQPCTSTSF